MKRGLIIAGAIVAALAAGGVRAQTLNWDRLLPAPAVPPSAEPTPGQAAPFKPRPPKVGNLVPGVIFNDCPECPSMVVIRHGSFTMGSPDSEAGRLLSEGPQHRVEIGYDLAVGRYPVTFDEWDACVAAGGCNGYRPSDQGWGRGRQPVVNVSWVDAGNYVKWLSTRTGQPYRLPTEPEWEYAARAGTKTVYWWGALLGTGNAVCDGCGSQWDRRQAAPVGSFKANPFGLFDMVGAVFQWVEDCPGDESYKGANSIGRAEVTRGCKQRVMRGGSWYSAPGSLRSAFRGWFAPEFRYQNIGFRVVVPLITRP
ncbi:MAG: formylglycine-generating enzyme family protein [Rhodospirillaceae bacterium]